jgi:lipopolysaccharide export system permease protein
VQEGTFTTIANKLTIYIAGRDAAGDVTGLLINDDRDPQQPVTILAERGAFADDAQGSRIVMVNGSRQRFDHASGKLSVLTFERYTLDLNTLRDAPEGRGRDPQERFLGELFWPEKKLDAATRDGFLLEGHQRLTVPLSVFSFVMIPLACLLCGDFNRRGQLRRVLLAVGLAFLFQALDLGVKNLAARDVGLIPLIYLIDLLPLAAGFGMLAWGGVKLVPWRFAPLAR